MAGGFFLLENTLGAVFQSERALEQAKKELEDMAPKILQYAKTNAPWSDRTGSARAGLGVEVDIEGSEVILTLSHGVNYGLFLETIQSGEFAIIMPTLEAYAAEVMNATNAIQTGEDLNG